MVDGEKAGHVLGMSGLESLKDLRKCLDSTVDGGWSMVAMS